MQQIVAIQTYHAWNCHIISGIVILVYLPIDLVSKYTLVLSGVHSIAVAGDNKHRQNITV